jgi:hypothetical protein
MSHCILPAISAISLVPRPLEVAQFDAKWNRLQPRPVRLTATDAGGAAYGNLDQIPMPLTLNPNRSYNVRNTPCHIWNTDQIPMPFTLNPNRSHNVRNTPCWIAVVGPSGLDKRQATVQLTIWADGAQVAPPLIIFRGGGCIQPEEKDDQS